MEEEKETKPNVRRKSEELKFGILETLILIAIASLVTFVVTKAIYQMKGTTSPRTIIKYNNNDIERFVNEYNFILDKYYGDIDSETLINNAIAGMVNNLNDPYSVFIDAANVTNFDVELDGEFYGLGVEIKSNEKSEIEVVNVLDGYEAKKSGIQPGDVILKLDDMSSVGMTPTEFRAKMIENSKETVLLTVRRGEETLEISVKRTLVQIDSVTAKTYDSGKSKVGYLGISVFASNTYSQFKEAMQKLESENIDSLIVDVRSNSGGHLSVVTEIISTFLDSSHVIYQVKDSEGVTKEYSKGDTDKDYKIVVLIDGASASASELLASALKEQAGATLIGTKSFGKSTVQQVVDLENGVKYKITIKEWLTSLGEVINGNGIKPDIEVELGEEYLKEPNDENDAQLQEAIKYLKK